MLTGPAGWGAPSQEDDFSGGALNAAIWNVYDSPSGSQPRIPSHVSVGGGYLEITGSADATGREVGGGISQKHAQLTGRWQVKVRVQGAGPASGVVLLWPKTNNWADGEVDMLESRTADRQSALNYLHNGSHKVGHTMKADFSQWHTIAVDWAPGKITFWLDNTLQWTSPSTGLVPTTSPMHLALQVDPGCSTNCSNTVTTLQADWTKVWVTP